jgi:hypothetical protein
MGNNYIERHKSWQKYAKEKLAKGEKPIPFKHWRTDLKPKEKGNMESVYFRGIKRETPESRLAKAGLSQAEINKFKGKSSKYKRSK